MARALGVLAFGALVALTLAPADWFWRVLGASTCLACGDLSLLNSVHNVFLFVPIGAVLTARLADWRKALLLACAASASVEVVQTVLPTRDASLEDLIMNSAGAAIGVLLVAGCARWLRPGPRLAVWLSFLWCLGALAVLGATAYLVGPTEAHHRDLFSQWAPPRPNFDRFAGRILGLHINGIPLPHAGIENVQADVRAAWDDKPVTVSLDAVVPPAGGRRPVLLARLFVRDGELVMFANREQTFMVRVALRASDIGLRSLTVSVPHDANALGRVRVKTVITNTEIISSVSGSTADTGTTVWLDVGLGWVLLLPIEFAVGGWVPLASAAWVALLVLPVGFYSAAAFSVAATFWQRWGGGLPAGLLIAGLVGIPVWAGVAQTQAGTWAGAGAGIGIGWVGYFRGARGRAVSRTGQDQRSLESRVSS